MKFILKLFRVERERLIEDSAKEITLLAKGIDKIMNDQLYYDKKIQYC